MESDWFFERHYVFGNFSQSLLLFAYGADKFMVEIDNQLDSVCVHEFRKVLLNQKFCARLYNQVSSWFLRYDIGVQPIYINDLSFYISHNIYKLHWQIRSLKAEQRDISTILLFLKGRQIFVL